MSTAELRANTIYKEYHLNNEDDEVKRMLMFMLLADTNKHKNSFSYKDSLNSRQRAWEHDGLTKEPCCYTPEEVCCRIMASESDAIAGRGIASEDIASASLNWI